MARAAGKTTKKRGRRPASRRKKKKNERPTAGDAEAILREQNAWLKVHAERLRRVRESLHQAREHTAKYVDLFEAANADSAQDAAVVRAGGNNVRLDLPVLDPGLLPEHVALQHMAIDYFELSRNSAAPRKKTLVDFLLSMPLSDGTHLSPRLADAMATFLRPLTAKRGGRPPKKR